jgi:hypothetical protein
MNKRFIFSALAATAANLVLHTVVYFLFLKDFYRSHPAGSEELRRQLVRPSDQMLGWALAISALTMGFLIAMVMRWAGARTFGAGLKKGAFLGLLFWSSVNFGLYSTSHYFSQASTFVDSASSGTVMMLSSAVAAWVLGRGSSAKTA